MYCSNCGNEVSDQAVVCTHCGCLIAGRSMQSRQEQKKSVDTLSIVGFILSFFVSIAGLIVSIMAFNRIKGQGDSTSENFAKAGIIISSVSLGLTFLTVIYFFAMWILVMLGTATM